MDADLYLLLTREAIHAPSVLAPVTDADGVVDAYERIAEHFAVATRASIGREAYRLERDASRPRFAVAADVPVASGRRLVVYALDVAGGVSAPTTAEILWHDGEGTPRHARIVGPAVVVAYDAAVAAGERACALTPAERDLVLRATRGDAADPWVVDLRPDDTAGVIPDAARVDAMPPEAQQRFRALVAMMAEHDPQSTAQGISSGSLA